MRFSSLMFGIILLLDSLLDCKGQVLGDLQILSIWDWPNSEIVMNWVSNSV